MSYTNETTYYGLPLPTGSDKSTFTDNNTAFQAVDAALHTAAEQSGAATEDIVTIKADIVDLKAADVTMSGDIDAAEINIEALQQKELLQDAAIDAVKADAFDMITAYNEPTATSVHAYNVGDFFIYNDVLYRATASIDIGDTIVPDTNCATTNVTTEIKDLAAVVSSKEGVSLVSVSPTGVTIDIDTSKKTVNVLNVSVKATINADRAAGQAVVGLPQGIKPLGASGTAKVNNQFLTITKFNGSTVTTLMAFEWQKLGDNWYIITPSSLTATDVVYFTGAIVVEND